MLAGSSFGGHDNRSPMLRSRLGAWGTQGLAVMARVLIGRTWVRADYAPGVPSALSPGPALEVPSVTEPLAACGICYEHSGRPRKTAARGHPPRQYGGNARSAARRTTPVWPPRGVVPVSRPTRSASGQSQRLDTGCQALWPGPRGGSSHADGASRRDLPRAAPHGVTPHSACLPLP
jgi:hypothetical protein